MKIINKALAAREIQMAEEVAATATWIEFKEPL
jgi:hypothetical protein